MFYQRLRLSFINYLVVVLISAFFHSGIQAQEQKKPCQGGSYELVKFYLGTWGEYRVTDSTETLTGTLTTQLDVNGCAISQVYVEQDSSFAYRSMGFVSHSSGLWEETYVFSTGSTAVFQWIVENDSLHTRRIGGSRSIDYIYRLKYVDTQPDEYSVIPQRSYDGGRTWTSEGRTRIRRIN